MSTPRCEDLSADLVAYLDGEQPDGGRARVEAHVATCLACRRELERLTKVRAWIRALPRIAPAADFEERMWQRLEADARPVVRPRTWRPARWSVPALAAAAAIALVIYASVERSGKAPTRPANGGPAVVARAPGLPAEQAAAGGDARDRQTDLATATNLSPEDVPPEVVEHPELFLRYPVIRRLNMLEHFEEVRRHGEDEPRGQVAPSDQPVG